jgi:(2S)-methylsuccinyl-CoA dehydrogenase
MRSRVRASLPQGDADGHQVAVNHLVWCYAYVVAAKALRDWASSVDSELASEMATVVELEALGLLRGQDAEATIRLGTRYSALALRHAPLEDVGARSEHRLLRASLRQFVEREVSPHASRIHRGNIDIPESIISGVAALGLFGLSVPEEYGGSVSERPDARAMLIATEELSRGSLGAAGSLITRPEILVRAVLRAGTTEQKQRWLPAIATGKAQVAIAVTEPDSGSDVAAVRCRASRVGESWEVNGTKLWSTFAGRAELLMLLCRTSDAGHRGLSVFVAEKPAFEGHEFSHRQKDGGTLTGRAIPTIGYRGMHTFELSFDRYRLPPIALLGGHEWLDRGFYLQLEGFAPGRLQTAGRAVGLMHAAVDAAFSFASQRRIFGKREIDFPLVLAKLGGMAARLEASRRLAYQAAQLMDDGTPDWQMTASLAKLYSSRMAEWVTREAMQLHGAMGYAEETDVSRLFVDARVLAIFEGAEDVLSLKVIGRSLLEGVESR